MAYRVKDLTPTMAAAVVSFAQAQVGQGYDWTGALGSGAAWDPVLGVAVLGVPATVAASRGEFDSPERCFCSELVLAAFSSAGVRLVGAGPNVSPPEAIVQAYYSGKLDYVGHLVA